MIKSLAEATYSKRDVDALVRDVIAGIEPEADDSEEFRRGFQEGMQALQSALSAVMSMDSADT